MLQDVGHGVVFFDVGGFGQEVDDDFRVSRRLKYMTMLFVLGAEEGGVDEIAVMSDGDGAHEILAEEGLGVAEFGGAGGGVADVADGGVASQIFLEHARFEDLGNQAHSGVAVDGGPVGDGDAGGFLAAVLEGEEALVGDGGGFARAPDGEEAAFFFFFVLVEIRGVSFGRSRA